MEFYERVSGARMHSNFIRPGGLSTDINISLLNDIISFTSGFRDRLEDFSSILSSSRI